MHFELMEADSCLTILQSDVVVGEEGPGRNVKRLAESPLAMSLLGSVKEFVQQRLPAAVEDILSDLETALTEYEEERQSRRQLLETAPKGEKSGRQQQEWPELEQRPIKEEQEEIRELHLTAVFEKSEDEEEKAPVSQPHQKHTEEEREVDQMRRETDGEDCGGLEPNPVSVSGFKSFQAATEDNGEDSKDIPNSMTNEVAVGDTGCHSGSKSFTCSKCGKRFGQKHHLQSHMRCHTGEKPFSCSLCGKRFTQKGNLTQHLTVHTREKPCSCPVCGEGFSQRGNLTQHMTVHTREKLCR
ncbi:zinc finger protein 35-like [Eleginops maclovinus]|uniref:zinc finger protein 35-like n=1 Tax=Eleginops maclovinus TaxID=56733 RepID=UPI0030809AEA